MFFKKKKDETPAPNRRRHPRVPALNLIKWSLANDPDQKDGWVENARDLSESGMRFCTEQEVPEKGLLHITLMFTRENQSIRLLGEIAWIKPISSYGTTYSQVGILFAEMNTESRQQLSQFMDQLQSSED